MDTIVYIIESSVFLGRTLKRLLSTLRLESILIDSLQQLHTQLKNVEDEHIIAVSNLVLKDAHDGEVLDVLETHEIPTIVLSSNYSSKNRSVILSRSNVLDYLIKSNDTYELATELTHRLIKNQNIKALVCSHSDENRMEFFRLLTLMQFEVHVSRDQDEALEIIKAHPDIQLALISSDLPESECFDLTRALRKQRNKQELGIIGIADRDHLEAPTQYIKYGANDFVKKPFLQEELIMRCLQTVEVIEIVMRLNQEAHYDFLTSLMNRRYFIEQATQYIQKCPPNAPIGLAMLDLDHFKSVNDTYGHDVGDKVLAHFAELAKKHFNSKTTEIARLGGEEFALLFKDTDSNKDKIMSLLESFRQALEKSDIAINDDESLHVTASIGCIFGYFNSLEEYLKEADLQLYKAKSEGRNQIQLNSD